MAYDPIIYGGSKSSVKGYSSAREKYFDELKKEQEKQAKETIAFGDTSGSSSKANTVEQSKNFFETVGDVVGGVGKTIGEGVQGAGDFIAEGVKGAKNLLDINAKQKQQKEYDKNKNEYLKQFLGDEDKYVSESKKYDSEHSGERGDTSSDFKEQARNEKAFSEAGQKAYGLAQYLPGVQLGVESMGTLASLANGDNSLTNKKLIELTQGKDWDKLSDEEKKQALAQRNLGAALGTLDLAIPGAKAGITGLKVGAKEGVKAGLDAAGKKFAASVGDKTIKELTDIGAKDLAKQTVKGALTGAGVGGALGVGINALNGGDNWQQAFAEGAKSGILGGMLSAPLDVSSKNPIKSETKSENALESSAPKLLSSGEDTVDGAIKNADDTKYLEQRKTEFDQIMANRKAGLNDDGSKFINLDEVNKEIADLQNGNYSDDLYDIKTSDGKPVDQQFILDASKKQIDALTAKRDEIAKQVDSLDSAAARESAMSYVNKLDDKIAALSDGDTKTLTDMAGSQLTRTLNPERVRAKFNQLQNDLAVGNFKQRAEMDAAAKRSSPARTLEEVGNDIDAVGSGGVAPEAVTPRADFVNIDEVVRHDNIPYSIKSRAISLAHDKDLLQQQLDNVMTPQKANDMLDKMDTEFKQHMQRIDAMPEPRKTAEAELLQSQYEKSYNGIQDQLSADSDTVAQLNRVQDQIQANMNEVIADANIVKDNNPTEFGKVDQKLNDKIAKDVEQDTNTAIFNRMSNADGVPESENINKVWAEAPDNISKYSNATQVNQLVHESLNDTFMNENVSRFTGSLRTNALNASFVGDAMSTPGIVLEKTFGEEGKLLHGEIIDGYSKMIKSNADVSTMLTEVKRDLGGDKELYKKVADVLEGKDIDVSSLTDTQRSAMNKLRDFYEKSRSEVKKLSYNEVIDDFKNRVLSDKKSFTDDEISKLAKRDGISISKAKTKYGNITDFSNKDIKYLATIHADNSTLDNYFPHIFDNKGEEVASSFDTNYAKVNGNTKFGFMLHRMSTSDDYSTNIIDVTSRYAATLNKKIYLEPSLRKLDDIKLTLKASEAQGSPLYHFIESYQKQVKYNTPSEVGKGFNELVDKAIAITNPNSPKIGNNHYKAVLSGQRQVNALAALGGNVRVGILQLTQFGPAIGELGAKNTAVGIGNYLKKVSNPATHAAYLDELASHGIRDAGLAGDAYSSLRDSASKGFIKRRGEDLSNILMFMTAKADEFVRASTYEASLYDNLSKGVPKERASLLATATAANTNFLTSKVDMPLALNSDGVRSLTQFMTFPYKTAEKWKQLGMKCVKDPETGNWHFNSTATKRFAEMTVFYGLAFGALSQVAGVEPQDNIPFWGNIVGDSGLPQSPLASMVFGQDGKPGFVELLADLNNPSGKSEYEKEQNRQQTLNDLTSKMLTSLVPGGGQAKRTYDGYQSTQNGGVVSKDGKVRYIQNTDDASKLKATLFGQYSTQAGREWVNKKFPTLSEKQSEILNQQKSDSAKKRAYDFYSGLKNTQMKSAITPDIKDLAKNQPNKAQRLIADHNAEVKKAVDAYTAKYGDLSDYEKNYLMSKYYITVGNLENLSEDN